MTDGVLGEVLRGILPTLGVSALFAWAIWSIVRADAGERAERARLEALEDAVDRDAVDQDAADRPGAEGPDTAEDRR